MSEKDLPKASGRGSDVNFSESTKIKKNQSVIRSALSQAAGTFSSRILGFIRDAVMFALFSRGVTDAYVVAFRLPNLFRRLLGEGSLSVSFIPVYVEARARSRADGERLANAVFTVALAMAGIISVTCFVYMDEMIRFLVDDPRGFASVPDKVEQTIYLARIMIFYLVLVTTYAFHMAVANTLGHFFWPALGPTLFNFALIIFTILPFEMGRYAGSSQSWGVIAGGVFQVLIVAWVLIREGMLPRFTFHLGDTDVGRVFRNMLPGLFGLGVFQLMTIVNTKFAAHLTEGAQSYLYAADRVLELPLSLIAVSLGAALLPRFSELHTRGERDRFLAEANESVRSLFFLSMPAAVGMFVLALPISEVLFMRGSFSLEDAVSTSEVVRVYAFLMFFSSWSRVTSPAFYALKNTWLPAFVALLVLIVHVNLAPLLMERFGLPGLAAATSVSALLNVFCLQAMFAAMIGRLGYISILKSILRLLPGLAGLAAFCHFIYPLSEDLLKVTMPIALARTLALAAVIGVGTLIYFYLTLLTRSESSGRVFWTIRRRLFKL